MADISNIFAPPPALNSTPTYKNDSDEDIMGKEDFLTLLVAQLQNQDPLNPDDASEFTSQLAEFSSLEQLQNLNDSMEGLTSAQQQSDRFATMGLLGQDVIYADSTFSFDGTPVNVGYQLDGTADSVSMTIRDDNGTTVATLNPTEMTHGNHFLEWDGLDNEGSEVPAGDYHIVLQATAAGEDTTIAVSPLVQSEVTGVDFKNNTGEAILHTMAGAAVSAGLIIAVYQPNQLYNRDNTENEDDDVIKDVVKNITTGVTGTSTPQATKESAPTDEDQIKQDRLHYQLVG